MTNLAGQRPLYCHVRFSTQTVGPTKLPDFPYTCAEVGFDSLTYVAVLQAESVDESIEKVRTYWRDAKVFRVIRNQREMYEESATNVTRMGYVDHAPVRVRRAPFKALARWFKLGGV
jgi:hypothetical protein